MTSEIHGRGGPARHYGQGGDGGDDGNNGKHTQKEVFDVYKTILQERRLSHSEQTQKPPDSGDPDAVHKYFEERISKIHERGEVARDLKFYETALEISGTCKEAKEMIEQHQEYIKDLTPTSYATSVKEAQELLKTIGVELEDKKVSDVLNDIVKGYNQSKLADQRLDSSIRSMYQRVANDFQAERQKDSKDEIQNRQLDRLREHRYATYAQIEKIESQVNGLPEGNADGKQLLLTSSEKIKSSLDEHADKLFDEIAPRLATKLSLNNGEIFFSDEWRPVGQQQADTRPYRDFSPPEDHANPCGATVLARVTSMFHPEVASSHNELTNKFEEINHAHPEGEAVSRDEGWRVDEIEEYLNTVLANGDLRIPMQDGKGVRFEQHEDFSYEDLKAYMDVKDRDGNYIPVVVNSVAYDKFTGGSEDHAIVLRKIEDRYDENGDHYIHFHMWDPYSPHEPTSKYGLENILQVTYPQTIQNDNGWTRVPGMTAGNEVLAPVIVDL
jgi:hypothetical protein